jgi:RNA polymerase sigma-70 factor, ECF subfamily
MMEIEANPCAEDGTLMRRVAAGDRRAFGALVERYKDPLVAYLTRLAGPGSAAREGSHPEDLAQEAFLRLYQAAPRYREQGQLKAFLYRIATNLLRTEQRREARRRVLLTAFPLHGLGGDTGPHQTQEVLATEAQRQVVAALAALPMRYRVPLVLAEVEGWNHGDIAALLECRPGTVKSRIHRAKARLKEQLAPYWRGALAPETEGSSP